MGISLPNWCAFIATPPLSLFSGIHFLSLQCFGAQSKDLSKYTKFVNNYDVALETLRKQKQNSTFTAFAHEVESQKKGNRLTLSDTLIMPIQRVPRYVLLLTVSHLFLDIFFFSSSFSYLLKKTFFFNSFFLPPPPSKTFLETTSKHSNDTSTLEAAVEEIKKVAKYIDQKKYEAMSKAKVGEINSAVNGDCPPLVTETRTFVKEGEFVMLVNGMRALRHLFFFNDAILSAVPHQTNSQKKATYDFEWLIQIRTINLVSPIPVEDFSFIRGTNFIEPNLVMQEIQKLNAELEVERNIERSANKMAMLYKQEQSTNFKKGQFKDTTNTAETKMEGLNKRLKVNQDLMRLMEVRFGLLITTSEKKGFTLIIRSDSQREEWIKEINGLRTKLGQAVDRAAEVSAMEKQKARKDSGGFFSGVTSAINSTVVMSAQAIHFLTVGFSGYGDAKGKALPAASGLSRKPSKVDSSRSSTASAEKSERRRTMTNSPSFVDIMRAGGGEFTSIYDTHNFVTKSFKRPTHCDFCSDLIWGLGREGVKCPGKERLRTLILFSGPLISFFSFFSFSRLLLPRPPQVCQEYHGNLLANS